MFYSGFKLGRRGFINTGLLLAGNFLLLGKKIFPDNLVRYQQQNCLARPQQTEGPYFTDDKLNRADIRTDPFGGAVSEGVPLNLEFRVSGKNDDTCLPLEGAVVDVWHCDALGIYSNVADPNFDTRGKKFLRGYQVTDANGAAKFVTVVPGWYQGRAVHIHFKIRAENTGNSYEFTSQLYFDEAQMNEIFTNQPYTSNANNRVPNQSDFIYRNGGDELLLHMNKNSNGYDGVFEITLDFPVTDIEKKYGEIPGSYMLYQNHPNPFNPVTSIKYSIPESTIVVMKVYDHLGKEVKTLVNGYRAKGVYSIEFNGAHLANGVYFYNLKTNNFSETKKLVLLK